jgi:hypothetical protein
MIIKALGRLYRLVFPQKVGGGMAGTLPPVQIKMTGRVINPGDPDWIPSPTFVPPPNWPMPIGWQFDPHLGWSRVVEGRNSRTPAERLN